MEQEDGYMVAMKMEMRHLKMRDGGWWWQNGGRDKMLATVKLLRLAKVIMQVVAPSQPPH